jgi:hypothetical protein
MQVTPMQQNGAPMISNTMGSQMQQNSVTTIDRAITVAMISAMIHVMMFVWIFGMINMNTFMLILDC